MTAAPPPPELLAVPNVSEGRDRGVVEHVAEAALAAADGVRLLDLHLDEDHHRSVLTLAGPPAGLPAALAAAAREAARTIDLREHDGVHPLVGALDVAPVAWRTGAQRGPACATALVAADRIGECGIPVLLYGVLGGGRTRAELRRGGVSAAADRIARGETPADFGPARADAATGVTLVAARPVLVAFNLVLGPPADLAAAREVAARVREGGREGLPGVRALGLELPFSGVVQVSCNVEDHRAVPLARLVEAVRRHVRVAAGEVVGLLPEAALDGFPDDVPLPGFDPARHVHERVLGPA